MNFADTIKLAVSAIWAHKLRSFLTLLGMIIAISAFMLVLSALLGFNTYVDEKIAGVGSNTFNVQKYGFEDFKDSDTLAAAQRRNKDLTFEELDFIRKHGDLIKEIGAKARGTSVDLKRGTKSLEDIQVDGAEANIASIDKVDVEAGRYFTAYENENASRVAFIGTGIAEELFPGTSPIGKELSIRGIPYRIVGIRVAKGTVFGMPQDNFITIPLQTYIRQFGSARGSRSLFFVGSSFNDEQFDDAVEQARTLMRIKRKTPFGEKDTFGIFTPDAIAKLRQSVLGNVFIVILLVPGIALIVGSIVIMNIMLVAVTERTKEIGIRKALGASQSDILKQFLYEAATLSAIGGIIGLIVAKVLGMVVTAFLLPTVIPWYAAVISIGVSGAVGILAGLYPAWKAAQLDPIEALRAD
ncbi:MAG: ABC transporter permease [Aridibacter sp.]